VNVSAPQQPWSPERRERAPAPPLSEACPLCGAPLAPAQDWCLRCGAAARTRLAASPRWTTPVIVVAVVAAIALAVLAAALVKLAGESGSSAKALTGGSLAAPARGAGPGASSPAATAPLTPAASAPTTAATAPTTPAATPTTGAIGATPPVSNGTGTSAGGHTLVPPTRTSSAAPTPGTPAAPGGG
jgi:hypothetical protein